MILCDAQRCGSADEAPLPIVRIAAARRAGLIRPWAVILLATCASAARANDCPSSARAADARSTAPAALLGIVGVLGLLAGRCAAMEAAPRLTGGNSPFPPNEEALAQRVARAVISQGPLVVYVLDRLERRLLFINERVTDRLGYSPDALLALGPRVLHRLLHPGDLRHLEHLLDRWEKVRDEEVIETQYRLRAADGSWRWSHCWDRVFSRDPDGRVRCILGVAEDITARKSSQEEHERLKQQMLLSQELVSVGLLAGRVAHDINNILFAIAANVELLRGPLTAELPEDDPILIRLRQVDRWSQEAGALTRQLFDFLSGRSARPQLIDPRQLLDELHPMLKRLVGDRVRLHIVKAAGVQRIRVDPRQFTQLIMNLTVNARDAMPDGGVLTIATRSIELGPAELSSDTGARPGAFVAVSIRDTGVGMDPDTVQRIFEPFFTTKHVGQGTGLGLATVRAVVEQAHGHLHVQSQPQLGTTVTVCFPAARPESDPHVTTLRSPRDSGVSRKTILVCEDDPAVRDSTSAFLNGAGYRVLVAEHASQALELASRHGPIDLLLTDVVMPDMNGRFLAQRLVAERPTMEVLYVSGYAAELVAQQVGPIDPLRFLQKPLEPHELLNRVQQVLSSAGGEPRA